MENKNTIGIFVKNDIHGNPIKTGDTIRIKRVPFTFIGTEDEEVEVAAIDFTGIVRLTFSKGLVIRNGKIIIKPNTTDNCYNKWTWELISTYKND
jgi:hypothetical protein